PPFIATLGTMGFFRGMAKWASGSSPVSAPVSWLGDWVRPTPRPEWLGIAPGVWVLAALAVLTGLGQRATGFRRHTIAIGSNEDAARRCGVPVRRTKAGVYIMAGLFTGLAGAMQFARLTQGDPTVAIGMELDVIAAVVIGGASLAGGSGSIAGSIG